MQKIKYVSLTTDWGFNEPLINKAKFIIKQNHYDALDIMHHSLKYNHLYISFIIKSSLNFYPTDTAHIVAFDLYTPNDYFLFVHYNDKILILPDNGLIDLIALNEPFMCYAIPFNTTMISPQVFIQKSVDAIQQFENGNIKNICIENFIYKKKYSNLNIFPRRINNRIECSIIMIDDFENIVLYFTKQDYETYCKDKKIKIKVMRPSEKFLLSNDAFSSSINAHNNDYITTIVSHYADVAPGQTLARFNADGYLVIGVYQGLAASTFGFQMFTRKEFIDNPNLQSHLLNIKISLLLED